MANSFKNGLLVFLLLDFFFLRGAIRFVENVSGVWIFLSSLIANFFHYFFIIMYSLKLACSPSHTYQHQKGKKKLWDLPSLYNAKYSTFKRLKDYTMSLTRNNRFTKEIIRQYNRLKTSKSYGEVLTSLYTGLQN